MLILARVLGLFVSAPVLQSKTFPMLAKVSMMIWITVLFWFVVPAPRHLPGVAFEFVLAIFVEFLLGVMIGFASNLVLSAVEFGGTLIDAQMGLSTGQTLDPMSGTQVTIVARLLRWCAVIMFLSVNGHHMLLSAIFQSFKLLPLAHPINFVGAADDLVQLGVSIFAVGTQIAMPIILVIFFLDFALGMVSRVAPQVNVFQLGMEIKPSLGAVVFILMIPFTLNFIGPILSRVLDNVIVIMIHMKPVPL